MTVENIIHYEQHMPDIYKAFEDIEIQLAKEGFDVSLHHLVKLRASQVNGCAFCVKMHTREARRDGESDARLDRLVVWQHVSDYTPAEKAALAWTEALTTIKADRDYASARQALLEHYNEKQISILTSIIVMINMWNRWAVSKH